MSKVGWGVELVLRGVPLGGAADGVDLVLLCVPDAAVAEVAASIEPSERTVVAHCAGALTLEALSMHPRRASIHPLVALPAPPVGSRRLLRGGFFAVAGDPLASLVVEALGGRLVEPREDRRLEYHAAAVVASNHLVALLGQVERVAAGAGLPLAPFLDLAAGALEDVRELGPSDALTGPVSRGDWATVRAHLSTLDPAEREAYLALARAAARLAGLDASQLEPEL
ncbi:MAG: DUF2520 domain-containing protein [Actinobacteria bacterium]|nr:DUF2520 domain-containing protein [Actinomycetota bacterium]